MIRKIKNKEEKKEIARVILEDLPEWFGLPESTENYIEEGADLPFWAAFEGDRPIGFVNLTESSEDCGDVFCMGVLKECHRKGTGRKLMEALEEEAAKKYSYLQVKTVDEGHYDEYDQTIAFYKKVGFKKLEVFPTLWDEWNPCLILIKKIGA